MSLSPPANALLRRDRARALSTLAVVIACVSVAQTAVVLGGLIVEVATAGAFSTDHGKALDWVDAESLWVVAVVAWGLALGFRLYRRLRSPDAAQFALGLRGLTLGAVVMVVSSLANLGMSALLVDEWKRLPNGQSLVEYRAQGTPVPIPALLGNTTRALGLSYSPSMAVLGTAITDRSQLLSFAPWQEEAPIFVSSGPVTAAGRLIDRLCVLGTVGEGQCRVGRALAESPSWLPIGDQPLKALDTTALCGGRLCAIRGDGGAFCARPTDAHAWIMEGDLGVDAVAVTATFGCAGCVAAREGSVRCFLTLTPGQVPQSGVVSSAVSATQLASSENHGCAVQKDGDLVCWDLDPKAPDLGLSGLRPLPGLHVVNVAVGPAHACAVTTEGTTHCWGENTWGELGDGTTKPRAQAVAVAGVHDAVQVAVAGSMSCVVHASGAVSCWGKRPRFSR